MQDISIGQISDVQNKKKNGDYTSLPSVHFKRCSKLLLANYGQCSIFSGDEKVLKKNSDINCLILFSNFPKNPIESGNWISDFVEKLSLRGIKPFVLVPHLDGSKKHEIFKGIDLNRFKYFYPHKFQSLAYGNGGIPDNIKRSNLAKIQIPLFIISEFYSAIKIIKSKRIDIINSHWLIPQGFVGALCRIITKRPHIATLHSSEITIMKNCPFGKYLANFIIKNCDIVLSVSQHRANSLLTLLPFSEREGAEKKIKIIPMGVDEKKIRIHNNKQEIKEELSIKSKYTILFIGRLIEVKGCEYLIESMQSIADTNEDVLLLIVGGGPLEQYLKNKVKDKKLNKCIRFEGFVNHNIISKYYAIADIFVIPSIVDSSGYEEGLPVVLLEGLMFGLPIIGTKTKGVLEVIKDGWNGLLVDPKNPDQLASEILKLIHNTDLMVTLSNNAQLTAKAYDWNVIARRYSEIIHELNSSKIPRRGR